jgi:hypothetical protein
MEKKEKFKNITKVLVVEGKEKRILDIENEKMQRFLNFIRMRERVSKERYYMISPSVLEHFQELEEIVGLFNTLTESRRKEFFIRGY